MQFPIHSLYSHSPFCPKVNPKLYITPIIATLILALASLFSPFALVNSAQAASPITPYVYGIASSSNTYDVMVADGVNKDRRVARVKVDGVAFSNISTRLSTNASTAAFRVNGDKLGGSSLYSIDLKTGKYTQVAVSKTGAESIGAYVWSPAGNTMAFVRAAPAPDPANVDDAFGTIYIYSVGFKAVALGSSHGSDRLVGFSGDGLGVYVSRLTQTSGEGTLQDLVYLPLSGADADARLVLHSQPGLQYSQCAIWTPPGLSGRAACIAEGNFALASSAYIDSDSRPPSATGSTQPNTPPAIRLSKPNSLGVAVADLSGSAPILLRHDAEAFSFLGWKPDGTALVMGGTHSGASWAVDMSGNRRALDTTLRDLRPLTWSVDTSLVVLGDMPTTRLLTLNYNSGNVAATRYVGGTPKAGAPVVKLAVPYIHQVKDTAENGNGTWACGPTSVAMSLAYFGKLGPWTVQAAGDRLAAPSTTPAVPGAPSTPISTPTAVAQPTRPVTGADFGPYITNKYTAFGHTYDAVARDPSGNLLAGLYGTICPTGEASWQQMAAVLGWHGLSSQYTSISWDGIVGALRRGHPVLLGNELTSEGHIILVVGYTADGNLIVNDPYGNRFSPGYGTNDGKGVLYPWKLVTPRHALEIIGIVVASAPTGARH